jgi:hypothetical protein
LGDFDEHLTLVDEMMQSLDTLIEDEGERKRCYDFLNKLKEDIQQAKEMNYESRVGFLRKIVGDIEENLGTQAIKVKLEKVHGFVQSRIENPFISGLIDKMDKSKYALCNNAFIFYLYKNMISALGERTNLVRIRHCKFFPLL